MRKAVIGILFSEDFKKVLLIKRRDVPIWVLPGGGVEEGESTKTAIEREMFEETGLSVEARRLVGTYYPINKLSEETAVFECVLSSSLPTNLSPQKESEKVGFYELNSFPKPFFFLHGEWITDALKNETQPFNKSITSITWASFFLNLLKHPILILRYVLTRLGCPINKNKD